MLCKNAKTQFQGQVPCATCATARSAWVRKSLRVFHYSSSERSSLKALTHFAAAKKRGSEKETGLFSVWAERPPQPRQIQLQQGSDAALLLLHPVPPSFLPLHALWEGLLLRWDPSCAGWEEDKSYKPLVKTENPLVSSSSEIRLRLIVGVLSPFCVTDKKVREYVDECNSFTRLWAQRSGSRGLCNSSDGYILPFISVIKFKYKTHGISHWLYISGSCWMHLCKSR